MNNRGMVDFDTLRCRKNTTRLAGKTGFCFVQGNKIIKVYNNKYDKDSFVLVDPKTNCDLSKFKADTIVFPEEYIYENDKVVGEIMPYINSKPVYLSFNDKTCIKSIIDSYELVINDLYIYTNIDMLDLCRANVLYSRQNGFHIIDTSDWQFKDNSLAKNIYRFNSSLMPVIIDYAMIPVICGRKYHDIDKTYYDNMAKYGNAGKRLQDNMQKLICDKYNFLEVLEAYMGVYREYYSDEMKTLKDVKKLTKILKKG